MVHINIPWRKVSIHLSKCNCWIEKVLIRSSWGKDFHCKSTLKWDIKRLSSMERTGWLLSRMARSAALSGAEKSTVQWLGIGLGPKMKSLFLAFSPSHCFLIKCPLSWRNHVTSQFPNFLLVEAFNSFKCTGIEGNMQIVIAMNTSPIHLQVLKIPPHFKCSDIE